jgi:HSP20 family molecular chaperone IbpA
VDQSEANLEQGILTLRVPVAEEALPRTIEVRTS